MPEITEVVAESAMDGDTLAKHFTMRHTDALAGQGELPKGLAPAVEAAYRAFHRRIHQHQEGLTHIHASQ